MNIVEAFLELDKLNETVHSATGIYFPTVALEYEDLEIEFYYRDRLHTETADVQYPVDGLDVAAFIVEDCMTEEAYPDFFIIDDVNSKEADEWLIAHWEELLEKYQEQLLTHFEEAAKEKGADEAYAELVKQEEEM
jgi:hypothetical protein